MSLGNGKLAITRLLAVLTLAAASAVRADSSVVPANSKDAAQYEMMKRSLIERFGTRTPQLWAETVPGVKNRIKTSDKIIALTMDACGSAKGMGFDARLIEFLEREQVPATLFINARWIDPNRQAFDRLAANPLFEIANHGLVHKPASVNGKSAYGIAGTKDLAELVDEIELNARKLEQLTGKRPRFYRSGTAYYDEVAVQIAAALGHQVAGFSVLGDGGATFSRQEVRKALLNAIPGDIIIIHMNHPEAGTAGGIIDALPVLKKEGFRFVRLSEVTLE